MDLFSKLSHVFKVIFQGFAAFFPFSSLSLRDSFQFSVQGKCVYVVGSVVDDLVHKVFSAINCLDHFVILYFFFGWLLKVVMNNKVKTFFVVFMNGFLIDQFIFLEHSYSLVQVVLPLNLQIFSSFKLKVGSSVELDDFVVIISFHNLAESSIVDGL